MPEITIRQAGAGDAEALAELGARTFTDTFGHLYSADNLSAFLTENHTPALMAELLSDRRYHILVAEDARGALAGYAVAGPAGLPIDAPGDSDLEIKRLYVDAPAQGAGLGMALLQPLLDWCEAQNPSGIYLSVYAHNHGAQRLYRRYGFDKVKEYEFLVGEHRDPEFIFRKLG